MEVPLTRKDTFFKSENTFIYYIKKGGFNIKYRSWYLFYVSPWASNEMINDSLPTFSPMEFEQEILLYSFSFNTLNLN